MKYLIFSYFAMLISTHLLQLSHQRQRVLVAIMPSHLLKLTLRYIAHARVYNYNSTYHHWSSIHWVRTKFYSSKYMGLWLNSPTHLGHILHLADSIRRSGFHSKLLLHLVLAFSLALVSSKPGNWHILRRLKGGNKKRLLVMYRGA